MDVVVVDDPKSFLPGWMESCDGTMMLNALSFLDVKTLLQKEPVNKSWRKLCKRTILAKCGQDGPKAFESTEQLRAVVEKYCKYETESMEDIACSYGYPINKWDVSQIRDMSFLFQGKEKFNEYIGSWDVSHVTDMTAMFGDAAVFNQNIGS
jgi:hypothetical protein